jgi:hypothetical protein
MIPLIITQDSYEQKEQKRKLEVLKAFVKMRENGTYEGCPPDIFPKQLKLALMTDAERLEYLLLHPPTFRDSYGSIEYMPCGLHTVDDQGCEGQVITEKGKKRFVRWWEEDMA